MKRNFDNEFWSIDYFLMIKRFRYELCCCIFYFYFLWLIFDKKVVMYRMNKNKLLLDGVMKGV